MGVAAARKTHLANGNGGFIWAGRDQVDDLTSSRREDSSASITLLHPKGCGAGKDKLMIGSSKCVISGVLDKEAAVVRLGTEVTGCNKSIQREVLALCALQGTIALISDKGKTLAANASGQREQAKGGG